MFQLIHGNERMLRTVFNTNKVDYSMQALKNDSISVPALILRYYIR